MNVDLSDPTNQLVQMDNELLKVVTQSGRVITSGEEDGIVTVLHVGWGFHHSTNEVSVAEALIEVQRIRSEEDEPFELEHIRWAAVESVTWEGGY